MIKSNDLFKYQLSAQFHCNFISFSCPASLLSVNHYQRRYTYISRQPSSEALPMLLSSSSSLLNRMKNHQTVKIKVDCFKRLRFFFLLPFTSHLNCKWLVFMKQYSMWLSLCLPYGYGIDVLDTKGYQQTIATK